MSGRALLLPALGLLAGCGTDQRPGPTSADPTVEATAAGRPVGEGVRAVRASSASVTDVELAVPIGPALRGPGRCAEPVDLGGRRTLALVWEEDGRIVRRVAITFDGVGRVGSYNDTRGGMNYIHTRDSEPGTGIILTFGREIALIQNARPDGGESYLVPLAEALDAPELDVPRRWIQEVEDRCGP